MCSWLAAYVIGRRHGRQHEFSAKPAFGLPGATQFEFIPVYTKASGGVFNGVLRCNPVAFSLDAMNYVAVRGMHRKPDADGFMVGALPNLAPVPSSTSLLILPATSETAAVLSAARTDGNKFQTTSLRAPPPPPKPPIDD